MEWWVVEVKFRRPAGMAPCAVRAACSGAILGIGRARRLRSFRPLDAGGDIAAQRPYPAKSARAPSGKSGKFGMRRYGMLALLLFVVASGLAVTSLGRTEPVYAGKTASQWLDAGHEDASLAMHEIGPPAMPYILARLAREDPQYGSSLRYRRLWVRLPIFIREVLPKPQTANFDETRACSALLELGPGIVPDLARELQNKNPAVRAVSAHALRSLGERGRNIRCALPCLQKALEDQDSNVVRNAAMALARDHTASHE